MRRPFPYVGKPICGRGVRELLGPEYSREKADSEGWDQCLREHRETIGSGHPGYESARTFVPIVELYGGRVLAHRDWLTE